MTTTSATLEPLPLDHPSRPLLQRVVRCMEKMVQCGDAFNNTPRPSENSQDAFRMTIHLVYMQHRYVTARQRYLSVARTFVELYVNPKVATSQTPLNEVEQLLYDDVNSNENADLDDPDDGFSSDEELASDPQ